MHSDAKRSTALVLTCSDMRLQGAGNRRFLIEDDRPGLRDGYDLISFRRLFRFRGTGAKSRWSKVTRVCRRPASAETIV
jgi:hypothetical protein